MRIRSIRPEFWSSEDIAALPWDARLVFIGLWSYVDDNGVGRDVERLIVADLFPLDDNLDESSLRVHGALKLLADGGQITRYTVDGKPYLHITAFAQHQVINRPSKGRYPLPTSENAEPSPVVREGSVSPHATPGDGEGEKGRRGEVSTRPAKPTEGPSFDDFYAAYPRKEARRDAERAWKTATKRASPQTIVEGLRRHRFSPEKRFVPLPATWLNADRWADGQAPAISGGQPERTFSRAELEEILGPDSWQVPAPPADLDPEADGGVAYRSWARERTEEHRAERVRQAIAALERQR